MSGWSIRATTLADEAGVSALLQRSYPALLARDYEPGLLARALPGMTRAQPALLGSGSFYLACDRDRDRVIGCGGWTHARPDGGAPEPGLAHLRHFATDPSALRRGVGRGLVERCLSDARAAGCSRFEAWSTLTAAPFYAALGFERVAVTGVQMGPDLRFPAVVMRRDAGA